MGFVLVFIPTGQIFKIDADDSFTRATTLDLFTKEVEFLFEYYLRLPYVDEETEHDVVAGIRAGLKKELNLSYSETEFASKASDRGSNQLNHWIFPFIDFVKEDTDARWVGDSDSDGNECWPNLTLAEFEIIDYVDQL